MQATEQAKLTATLKDPQASIFAKAKACQRLAVIGDEGAVPAIAPLLNDEKLSVYARFALEPMPGQAPDNALKSALPNLQGNQLIGAINSLANRRSPHSIDAVSKYVHDKDPAVARAAIEAMAKLRPPL